MPKRIPRTLYHYCSASTFFNIIKTKSIWLSDISKSNDSQELQWIKERCRYYILKAWVDYVKLKDSAGELSNVDFELFEETEKFSDDISKYNLSKSWVFCFSEKKDNLGQWRGYADDGTGVCIGFKSDYFRVIETVARILDDGTNLYFRKVHYAKKDIEDFFYNHAGLSRITAELSTKEVVHILDMAVIFSMQNAEFFKNDMFREEREWRLVYTMDTGKLRAGEKPKIKDTNDEFSNVISIGNYDFSVRGKDIVSHVTMTMPHIEAAISNIIIGPKSPLTVDDVTLFLIKSGIIENAQNSLIKIEKSSVPYQ